MSIFGKTPYIEAKISALSDEQKSALATAINSSADDATVYSLIDLRALSVDTIGAAKIQFNPACLRSGYLILKYNSFCTFITNELYYTGKATVIDIDLANLKYKEIKEDCTVEEVRRIMAVYASSSSAESLEVNNITTLTNEQINNLKCGDVVIKKTGNQQHCYEVTYKEANQGICLTYTDANVSETVSYDYSGGNWVYNSTDVNQLLVKANPSDNATGELVKETIGNAVYSVGDSVNYLTSAPASANTSGRLKFVVLSSEPATYYDGYYYIITGA